MVDQQDFDEFDNLVDEPTGTVESDMPAYEDSGRKKRQMIFYMALVLMILIGGGIVWFLFLRQPDLPPAPVAAAMPPQQSQTANGATPPAAAPNETAPLPPGVTAPENAAAPNVLAVPGDTAAMPPATPGADTAAMPAADASTPPAPDAPAAAEKTNGTTAEALPPPTVPAPDGSAPAMPTPAALPGQPNAQEPMATAPSLPSPTGSDMPSAPPKDQMAATPPAPSMESGAADQRMTQMEEQVKALSNELAVAKAGMGKNTGGVAGGDASAMKALNDKLDRLASQVEALDQRTTNFATELQNRPNASSNAAPAASTSDIASEAKPVAKAKPAKAKSAAKKTAPKYLGAGWELRSAQPGAAWLGRQGSSEMNRYAVGDAVPGLGTVQAVTQENGRWTVKTTGGTMRQ